MTASMYTTIRTLIGQPIGHKITTPNGLILKLEKQAPLTIIAARLGTFPRPDELTTIIRAITAAVGHCRIHETTDTAERKNDIGRVTKRWGLAILECHDTPPPATAEPQPTTPPTPLFPLPPSPPNYPG